MIRFLPVIGHLLSAPPVALDDPHLEGLRPKLRDFPAHLTRLGLQLALVVAGARVPARASLRLQAAHRTAGRSLAGRSRSPPPAGSDKRLRVDCPARPGSAYPLTTLVCEQSAAWDVSNLEMLMQTEFAKIIAVGMSERSLAWPNSRQYRG